MKALYYSYSPHFSIEHPLRELGALSLITYHLDIPLGGLGGLSPLTYHLSLKHPPRGLGGLLSLGGFPPLSFTFPPEAVWGLAGGFMKKNK